LTPVASGLATCTTDCDNVLRIFLNQVSDTPAGPVYWAGPGLMFGLPALIGLFWGAPLVARDLEAGTHRLVWTPSVTRTRWLVVKLIGVGAVAMAAAAVCSVVRRTGSGPCSGARAG
jgi:ABC-type transport system involved in multi-copper enzyme maturation permease subunit